MLTGLAVRHDFAWAARALARHPTFTGVAVLVLAIGIGATTAIFSAVNALLLNPYPFPGADRLVAVDARHQSGRGGVGYRDFLDWRSQNVVFDEMAIVDWRTYVLNGLGEPQRVTVGVATSGVLDVVRVRPQLGRFFTADEDRPGASPVVVLGHAAWQRRYGGRPDVLGQTLELGDVAYTIVGVMPAQFVFPGMRECEFWTALRDNPANSRYQHQYSVLARLKPGVTVERAQGDMTAIAQRLEAQYPESNTGWGVVVLAARRALAAEVGRPAAVLFAAVGVVLLLVCANVSGLMLARGTGRAREIAVRAAMGASRARIVRQLLTESVVLAVLAGLLGGVIARWLVDLLRVAAPPDSGLAATMRIDATVLGFAIVVSLMTSLLFGLAPALYGSRADVIIALKGGAEGWGGGRARARFLTGLVVVEIALSAMLLVTAALLVKNLTGLLRAETGLKPDRVLTFALQLPPAGYPSAERRVGFYRDLLERLRGVPGVEAAGAVSTLPMSGAYSGGGFEIEGRPAPADWTEMSTQYLVATPGYLRAMGIPLRRGREIDDRDTAGVAPVVVVDESFAHRYFQDGETVGHRVKMTRGPWMTIVGVVGSIRHGGPTADPRPQMYFSHAQAGGSGMSVVVRASGDPLKLAPEVRRIVRELDAGVPVERLRTMRQVLADSLSGSRLLASFLAAFAGFALVLAAIGVYGVIAYSVSQRTHEMGVRIALGASRRNVAALVLGRAAIVAGAGVITGVLAAMATSTVMGSLLFGVNPRDPAVLAGVAALLIVVALTASYLPARRAARVDPIEALRAE